MWIMWRVGVSGMDKKYSHAMQKQTIVGKGTDRTKKKSHLVGTLIRL
jgi:hypothetical protein